MNNEWSPGAIVFSRAFQEAKEIAKGPAIFSPRRGRSARQPEFRLLRRWNSHTPSLLNVCGGGYFLWWNKCGTVIDPGERFLQMVQEHTHYGIGDMNMVVVSHDHVDH